MKTWWLYFGGEVIGSVRMEGEPTPDEVRAEAIKRHRWIPLPAAGVTPYEHEQRLRGAEVRS